MPRRVALWTQVLLAAFLLSSAGCTGFVRDQALRSLGSFVLGVFGEAVDETLTPNRD